MKKLSLFFLIALFYTPSVAHASAEGAYAKAKACYAKLKATDSRPDPVQWEHCMDMFATVQKKYPKEELGAQGLYSVGRMKVELYMKLKRTSDADGAIKTFNQFVKEYLDSSAADDALFEIAKLRRNPFKEDARARVALNYIIQNYPEGDMVPAAEEMLSKISAVKEPKTGPEPAVREEDLFSTPSGADTSLPKEDVPKVAAKPQGYAGPDSVAFLGSVDTEELPGATQVMLSLSRKATYSLTFEQEGPRTKRPPVLTAYLPYTKPAGAVKKEIKVNSAYLSSIEVSKGVLSGGAKLKFVMKLGATYDVSTKGEKIIFKFRKGNGAAMPGASKKLMAERKTQEQASDKTKTVVIVVDPGHGGKDTGAIGKKGLKEKEVTLSISRRVADKLRKNVGARVFLTRSLDKTLTLEDRDAIAVSKKADLFLSIHANASTNRKMAGIETYYLNNATDEAAARLARRENRSAGKKLSDVEHILSTMLQNYDAQESESMAREVQKSLMERMGKRHKGVANRKVRSALFYVLVGAKCPAILVETSFISNPTEERRLRDPKYQEDLAIAIAGGVKNYLNSSEKKSVTL